MVAIKNALALGLLASTASAASHKRHAHHRRHNKEPCTSEVAPFPVGNSTVPAGTGVSSTESAASTPAPITYTVVPVPVSSPSAPVEASSATQPIVESSPAPVVESSAGSPPPPPAASGSDSAACGVATSYVTVQQTVTVTAGMEPAPVTSKTSTSAIVHIAAPSSKSTPVAAPVKETPAPAPTTTIQAPVVVPETTTSAKAAPSTPIKSSKPVSGSYSGKKMGASWDPNQTYDFSSLGVNVGATWIYDWGQVAHGVPNGVEYVPTLHDSSKCADFANQVGGASYLKHFNEPDMCGNGGCCLSPGEAAGLHDQYISGLSGSHAVGLPAVTSNNIPGSSGTGWLESFVGSVKGGCNDFSFADFHFYGGGESAEKQAEIFLGYVDSWIETVDKICPGKNLPIWISEFSATPVGDTGIASSFMQIAGPKLEANSRVARYAYFLPQNSLIKSALSEISSVLGSLGI